MQGRRGAADRVAERRLRVRPPVPAHRHLVSNGGEWYSGGSLEPLPKIHLGGTSWLDDNALSPLPGEWGYSPLDDYEPYASPYGADAADSLSGASTDGSRSVAQPSKCQTCEQALIASERLTTMMAIQCLWEAASREVDASGRPLTHGLSPSDPNRAGLLRKLRERCAATRRGIEEPSEPLGRLPELGETEAKEPKCDTCADALATIEKRKLSTPDAIRCLWKAASQTYDSRRRPLTHGLYAGDSDRAGLLRKLRERCDPTARGSDEPRDTRPTKPAERKTVAAEPPECDTCAQALAAIDTLKLNTPEAIWCLWGAASRTLDSKKRPLTHGLLASDPDRAGLLRKLRARCAAVVDDEPPKTTSKTAAAASTCDTCTRALAIADLLPLEEGIRCLWGAASRIPDGRGGTLTDGLDPQDPDRLGLLAELRARCQATEGRTVALASKCETCLQALAIADLLPLEEGIRCLWDAASRTRDINQRPLIGGLDPDDSDRVGLLTELRLRCAGCDNCDNALGMVDSLPLEDAIRCLWSAASRRRIGNDRLATDGLSRDAPDRQGLLNALLWRCAAFGVSREVQPQLRGLPPSPLVTLSHLCENPGFPCPPPRLDQASPDVLRWWLDRPRPEELNSANLQVFNLHTAVAACADDVARDALAPVTFFDNAPAAESIVSASIDEVNQRAHKWGQASLRNMSDSALANLAALLYGGGIVPPTFHTFDLSLVAQEQRRPVRGRPFREGFMDAAQQAGAFLRGLAVFEEERHSLDETLAALRAFAKCKPLFRLPDRRRLAQQAPRIIDDLHTERPVGALSQVSYDLVEQRLRTATTRYDLSEALCELLYLLCCAQLQCDRLKEVLRAIRAIEQFRRLSNRAVGAAVSTVAAILTYGASVVVELLGADLYDCSNYEDNDSMERDATTIINSGLTQLKCNSVVQYVSDAAANKGFGGSVNWEMADFRLGGESKNNEELKKWVDDFLAGIGTSEFLVDLAHLVSFGASMMALAIGIVNLGIAGWRAYFSKREPPTVRPTNGKRSGVWEKSVHDRGLEIEQRLGGNLPDGFPTVDKWSNGTATSIKSVDLKAPTYQDSSSLQRVLNGYVDKVADFRGWLSGWSYHSGGPSCRT